jgi:predicted  nucleic acid-binding Zn-ribbon protein
MGVAKQLYQLQEIDLEIEASEQALSGMVSRLGENRAVVEAQTKLTSAQRQLDELKHRQRSVEWEIDDLVTKITAAEGQLYSGRINNPKELSNLQHEVDILKAKRDQLENKALEIMGQVEMAEAGVAAMSNGLNKLEAEWQEQQKQLSADIASLKSKLSDLGSKRQLLSAEIDPKAVEVYEKLRKQKGRAVAKVEQGICRGCRISLPFSELQGARSGNLVQCGSCGRILFLP